MPTELPYAAEAESSLSYDELEVSPSLHLQCRSLPTATTIWCLNLLKSNNGSLG